MTTASKRAASPKRGGGSRAAKAEKKGRTLDFEGLQLTIPPKLPTSFSYRFAKISALEDRDENAAGEIYELLVSVIGAEQFDKVAAHADTLKKGAEVGDLLVALIEEYGTDSGN